MNDNKPSSQNWSDYLSTRVYDGIRVLTKEQAARSHAAMLRALARQGIDITKFGDKK